MTLHHSILIISLFCLIFNKSFLKAEDSFTKMFLHFFPRADIDRDGMLSRKGEVVVSQRVIQRYPKADLDSDSSLSDKERNRLLRQAASRRNHKNNVSQPTGVFFRNRKSALTKTKNPAPTYADLQ